jgi:hypothetical protein
MPSGSRSLGSRLCTIAGFYKYAVEEELLEHSPAAHVHRPRLDYESHATALDRNELGDRRGTAPWSSPERAARSSPFRSLREPPERSTWPSASAPAARYSSPAAGGGWTGTAPPGSSAG